MPKLPSNFNWKESAIHVQLLEYFSKPHDINHVLNEGSSYPESLGEKTEDALERFIQAGFLMPASLNEILDTLLQVSHLKMILQQSGLSIFGRKDMLIETLINGNRIEAENIAKNYHFLKCSETGLAFLKNRNIEKSKELENAKYQSFDLFKSGNAKEAYKIYAKYQKKFSLYFKSSSSDVEELQSILLNCPLALGEMTPENQKLLQAATCMKILWKDDKAERWLPENFATLAGSNQRAINYLARNAYFKSIILENEDVIKGAKITFRRGDIESCELCLALKDQIFNSREIPDLPIKGCTSETGCMCDFELIFDHEIFSFTEEDDDDDEMQSDSDQTKSDLIGNLKTLKTMLNEGLISESEYDEKKKEILSRL